MSYDDLPQFPAFAVPDPDQQAEVPHLHCAAGWRITVEQVMQPEYSPAVVGVIVATSQECLNDAAEEVSQRFEALRMVGVLAGGDREVEVQLAPEPLGPVTDGDGNPVDLDTLGG